MRTNLLTLGVSVLMLSGPARAEGPPVWAVDMEESRLGFQATQMGGEISGAFATFAPEIRFDPEALATSAVTVTIDMGSVGTGNDDRDAALRSRDFFDIDQFPTATFAVTGFRAVEDGAYEADASLTMRDVTMDVVLPFTLELEPDGDQVAARVEGALEVSRLDYDIGRGQWRDTSAVGETVVIEVDLLAHRPADP